MVVARPITFKLLNLYHKRNPPTQVEPTPDPTGSKHSLFTPVMSASVKAHHRKLMADIAACQERFYRDFSKPGSAWQQAECALTRALGRLDSFEADNSEALRSEITARVLKATMEESNWVTTKCTRLRKSTHTQRRKPYCVKPSGAKGKRKEPPKLTEVDWELNEHTGTTCPLVAA